MRVSTASLATSSSISQLERATNNRPLGALPATGRGVTVPFCEVWRLDPEGRIVAGDLYYDQLSLMVQLGHVQPPSAG